MATNDTPDDANDRIDHHEFGFYVYEQDEDDPRFSFWGYVNGGGMPLFEHQPNDHAMWQSPEKSKTEFEFQKPTDELKSILHDIFTDGVDTDRVQSLAPHEREFVSYIHGTLEESEYGLPTPVWNWINFDCGVND